MTNGKLVVITGPAASGKSTIAKGLQSKLSRDGDLWLAMELDVFGRAVPRDWVSMGTHQGRYAERGFAYKSGNDDSVGLVLGSDGRRVLTAFHRTIAAIVKSGINVICEAIVYDDDDWDDWSGTLCGISPCWVKLTAPVAVLEDRERADRTGVFRGLARGMSARKPVGTFDIEADTASEDVSSILRRIGATLVH